MSANQLQSYPMVVIARSRRTIRLELVRIRLQSSEEDSYKSACCSKSHQPGMDLSHLHKAQSRLNISTHNNKHYMSIFKRPCPSAAAYIAGSHLSSFYGIKVLSRTSCTNLPRRTFSHAKSNRIRATLSEEPSFEKEIAPFSDEFISGVTSEEYFDRLRTITESEAALSNPFGLKKSHEIVRFDEDGMGPRDRYVYVEERDCIGCSHCATTAPGTFFLEQDFGRARVFDQIGENETAIEEAIDTCPVNCIYYVNWEDLVKLENMRDEQRINKWARLVGGQDFTSSRRGRKSTTVMDSGIIRCEDCPGRGCGTCPLYGVGKNPEYLRQKAIREERLRKRITEGRRKKTRRRM